MGENGYLATSGLTASDNLVIMGDFNLIGSNLTYTVLPPSGLPGSYVLGTDVTFPVEYTQEALLGTNPILVEND